MGHLEITLDRNEILGSIFFNLRGQKRPVRMRAPQTLDLRITQRDGQSTTFELRVQAIMLRYHQIHRKDFYVMYS